MFDKRLAVAPIVALKLLSEQFLILDRRKSLLVSFLILLAMAGCEPASPARPTTDVCLGQHTKGLPGCSPPTSLPASGLAVKTPYPPTALPTSRPTIVKASAPPTAVTAHLTLEAPTSVSGSDPLTPIAAYQPLLSEAPITTIYDTAQVSCDEKPLYNWRSPGKYLYRSGDKYYVDTVTRERDSTTSDYPASRICEDIRIYESSPYSGIGQTLTTLPEVGNETTSLCTPRRAVLSGGGKLSTIIAGVEPIVIWAGTVQAVRLDTSLEYMFLTGPHDWFEVIEEKREWYACGYGLIQAAASSTETKNQIPAQSKSNRMKLISFTPLSTNESHVRHILVDIQLGNVADYYRANITNEETAEALRRWGGGIRVVNSDEFERITIDEQWVIVQAGTETPITGMDVVLNSD